MMTMKYLAAILPLLVVCWAQYPLPNSAYLDNGNYIMRWSIGPIGSASLASEIEIQVNCTGWVSLTLVSPSGTYGDVHWAAYNDTTDTGLLKDMHVNLSVANSLPEEDPTQDLIFQGAVFHEPWTIIRLRRLGDTGDATNDVPIVRGSMTINWAYSNSDAFEAPAVASGSAIIAFMP